MKRLSFLLGVIFVLIISSCGVQESSDVMRSSDYSCELSLCDGDNDIKILNIESSINSHVGLPTSSEYPNYICCDSSISGDFEVDSDNPSEPIFSLSNDTNAHIGYADDYEYGIGFTGTSCEFEYDSCSDSEFCIFSFTNEANSHISVCGEYSISLCCGEGVILEGCTDPNAHNYDPDATSDDGSCLTCSDAIQNGDEEGIDCGGVICEPCGDVCGIVNSYWMVFNQQNDQWDSVSGDEVVDVGNNQITKIVVEGNNYCIGETVTLNLYDMNEAGVQNSPSLSGDDDGEVVGQGFPEILVFGSDNIASDYWYVSGCGEFPEDPNYRFVASYSEQEVSSGILNVLCDNDADLCGDGYYDQFQEDCDLSGGEDQCSTGYLCQNCDCVSEDGGEEDCDFDDGFVDGDAGEECDFDDLTNCVEGDDMCIENGVTGCGECAFSGDFGGDSLNNCQAQFGILGECLPCDNCPFGGQSTQEFFVYSQEGVGDPSSDCENGHNYVECYTQGYSYGEGDPYEHCDNYYTFVPQDCYITLEEDVPFFDWFSIVFGLMILTSYYLSNRKQKVL